MEIDVSRFIEELVIRSLDNYDYIKSNCKKEGLSEVTQLINTMYCTLVVPEEIFVFKPKDLEDEDKRLRHPFGVREKRMKSYEEYQELLKFINMMKEQNRIKFLSEDRFVQESPVSCLLYNIRNSLCHEGVGFLPIVSKSTNKNEITDVIFEAKSLNGDKVKFISVFSVAQLERFVQLVSALFVKIEEGRSTSNNEKYRKYYQKLEKDVEAYLGDYVK